MTKLMFLGLATIVFLFSGCLSKSQKKAAEEATRATDTLLVGGDKDEHGCLGSAGYTWSEVRKDCIRIFESGIQMTSTTDPEATSAAYLVFSADSLQVELFLPEQEKTEILDRRSLPKGGYAWNIEDDDTKNVRYVDGKWVIEQRGKLIYNESIKEN